MILCEQIIGKCSDKQFEGCHTDEVEIQWYEAYKRIHRKTTRDGREIGIRLGTDILTKGLREGDVLYQDGNGTVTVVIAPCQVIVIEIDRHHPHMACKVCYEIGNRHAALLWGDTELQFITPYNEPTLSLLSKLHGISAKREVRKLDFDKSISSVVSSHTH